MPVLLIVFKLELIAVARVVFTAESMSVTSARVVCGLSIVAVIIYPLFDV